MTWGPFIRVEPMRTLEEAERIAEERIARARMRRLGWILALVLCAVGVRNCAAVGDRMEREAACAIPPKRDAGREALGD